MLRQLLMDGSSLFRKADFVSLCSPEAEAKMETLEQVLHQGRVSGEREGGRTHHGKQSINTSFWLM